MSQIETFCEGRAFPLGIDERQPHLSWRIVTEAPMYTQRAYRVWVASSPGLLDRDEGDLWDPGQVESARSTVITYAGLSLKSRQRCYWKVRLWCDGEELQSDCRNWEMGLLDSGDWEARWIGNPAVTDGGALYFHRAFSVEGEVESARLYASGLGYHELRLNGEKVGEQVLDPAWTAYDKRVLYSVYDVAERLRGGDNVIGAMVGNGWYGMPKLCLQLEIRYRDGRTQRILSRGGHTEAPAVWLTGRGGLRWNSVYDGEYFDARLDCPGWDAPSGMGSGSLPKDWGLTAIEVDAPAGVMCAQALEPIRVMERFAPLRIQEPEPGVYVFDAGRNMAGWAVLRLKGERGQCVRLRYAETLGPDGKINTGTLRQARATDTYLCKGEEVERWEPRFTYHGFRYVQVEGLTQRPDAQTLTLCLVRSAVEQRGSFRCDHELLEQIESAVIRTEESNLHGVPTDCPQRNERFGWLNDMTVRTEEAVYHFGMERFLEKWCADIADTQCPVTGSITDTAPFAWGKRPADPVSASFLLVPWLCYLHYGNDRLMRSHYAQLERWVEFLLSQSQEGVLEYSSWGDWSPPEAFAIADSIGAGAVSRDTPGALVSTAYLQYQCALMAKIAYALRREDDAHHWRKLADEIKEVFHERFWNPRVNGYGSGNQACNALALYLELVPEELKESVVTSLVRDVEQHDYHLTTGNLCTKYLLEVLSMVGYADVAFRIVAQTSYPGWGYMITQGATTLWERWENKTDSEMNSHNHPMLGSVSTWFFKYLVGIAPDESEPGFRRFIVRPHPVAALGRARADYTCPQGEIRVGWEYAGSDFILDVTVPNNTRATLDVPSCDAESARVITVGRHRSGAPAFLGFREGRATYEAGPGQYRFHSTWAEPLAERSSVSASHPNP